MPSTKETRIRKETKLSELDPTLETTFDYSPPAPAAPVEKQGGQAATAEDAEQPRTSGGIRFPGLDHLVDAAARVPRRYRLLVGRGLQALSR